MRTLRRSCSAYRARAARWWRRIRFLAALPHRARARQEDRRLDGRCCRVGRLLCRPPTPTRSSPRPSTITGSIGVVGGKLIIGPAMDHYLSTNTETHHRRFADGGNVHDRAAFQPSRARRFRRLHRPRLCRFHRSGRGRARHDARSKCAKSRAGGCGPGSKRWSDIWSIILAASQWRVARARALAGIDADARVQLALLSERKEPVRSRSARLFGASAEACGGDWRALNAALSDPRVQQALAAMREEDANVRAEAGRVHVR